MALKQRQRLYETVLGELKDRLVSELGGQIEAIIVYGSVARGDSHSESDIDVMIVSPKKNEIYHRASSIRTEIDLEHETMTTLFYVTPDEFQNWLERGSLFLREVLKEGVAIYGKQFLRHYQKAFSAG